MSDAPDAIAPAQGETGKANSQSTSYRLSQRVDAEFREKLAQDLSNANPEQAAGIRATLADDRIWKQFSQKLDRLGFSSNDLADVMTGYYAIIWSIVNDRDAAEQVDGLRASRERFAELLLANQQIMSMPDAEKQKFAQGMGYTAAMAEADYEALLKKSDTQGLSNLRWVVQQMVAQEYGVDLRQLKLTPQGFLL